jgi:hypothetical protein
VCPLPAVSGVVAGHMSQSNEKPFTGTVLKQAERKYLGLPYPPPHGAGDCGAVLPDIQTEHSCIRYESVRRRMRKVDLDRGATMQKMTMMYYPFVHPPRPVLWQALLYWDALTSISPQSGYVFGRDLMTLQDLELYRPTHADDLPEPAWANLVSDLRQVVVEVPTEDLVPVPGPLAPENRLFWGKLPSIVQAELITAGALVPTDHMLKVSPVLLSRLMVVLAKHLAAAERGVIPFTDSPEAHEIAYAPLGPDLQHRRSWQMQIGHLLPIPAPDTPMTKVLDFRQAYDDERKELAGAVSKLLLATLDPAGEADPVQVQRKIKKAVRQMEKAGSSRGILWLERSLWALAGLGAAAAGKYALPTDDWLFAALSGLGISVATVVTRTGVSTEFAYLQHLRSTLPNASWPTAAPTT